MQLYLLIPCANICIIHNTTVDCKKLNLWIFADFLKRRRQEKIRRPDLVIILQEQCEFSEKDFRSPFRFKAMGISVVKD